MSGLIKCGYFEVASHPSPSADLVQPITNPILVLETEIQRLSALLEHERTIASERELKAHAAGVEEGRTSEKKQRDTQHETLLRMLKEHAVGAMALLKKELLEASEQLALALTLTALERVLGDPTRYRELVTQTTSHRLQMLTTQSIVSVRVSKQDFPPESKDDFENNITDYQIRFIRDASLASGHCGITLSVGELDLSIPIQLEKLLTTLREIASHA